MTRHWWLEIGPLKEGNYTGISQVTAALADCLLGDTQRQPGFFYGRAVIPVPIVASVLTQRHGELLEWYVARAELHAAPTSADADSIAIFPNRKTCRRGFGCETQIIHDLSTLLTPQFHGAETVAYHALSLRDDVHSNDLTFCVSEATRSDLLAYLGPLDPARVVTTLLGGGDGAASGPQSCEPYVLVLGTVEPRKNIVQVLQFLAEQPQVLRGLRFVFLGRHGWGETPETLLARHGLTDPFAHGRILFPGFVSDAAKHLLIGQARLLIYPSLFEGFGLPVLEALAAGTPCLTTRSSSLPEVGGAVCCYFDPFIPGDFAQSFAGALHDTPALRARRVAHAAAFTWSRCWASMTTAVETYLGIGILNAR